MRLLVLLLCLAALCSFGQPTSTGYITTKDGNRINGKIEYNPKKGQQGVVWLQRDGELFIFYPASKIAGFTLSSGSQFVSVVEKATKDTVFAEVQYEGAVRVVRMRELYVFSKGDEEVQAYLPIKKTPQMLELEVKDMVKQELVLIGSLTNFLSDCPDEGMQRRLRTINFAKIKNEFVRYSKCKKQPFTKLTRTTFRVGLLGGLQFPNVVFEPAYNVYDGKSSPFGGMEVDVIPASFHARTALNFGLMFGTYKFGLREGAPAAFNNNSIDYSSYRIPVTIKFFMRPGHSGFFIQPGLQWSVNGSAEGDLISVNPIAVFGMVGVGWEQNIGGRNWLVASVRAEYSLLPAYLTFNQTNGNQGGLQVALGYRFHFGG